MASGQKLIKNFQCYPKSGIAPLMVGFTIDGVANNGVLWRFGDGESITKDFTVSHTYKKAGTYNGFVQLADPRDDTVTENQPFTIVVSPAPKGGIITDVFQENAIVTQNTTVNFGVHAKDIVAIKKAIWYWGDGSDDDVSKFGNARHPYRKKGQFEGKVTIFTGDNKQDSRPFYMLVY